MRVTSSAAVRQYVLDKQDKKPFNPIEYGFEFSMHEIRWWVNLLTGALDRRVPDVPRRFSTW